MQSKLLQLTQRDPATQTDDVLSDDVVFHSPVRDYRGRADVTHIVTTIGSVLDEIAVQRELVDGRQLVTIITAAYGDEHMTGVLDETHDAAGHVESATLLLRPLSVLSHAIAGMREALDRSPLPSTAAAGSG